MTRLQRRSHGLLVQRAAKRRLLPHCRLCALGQSRIQSRIGPQGVLQGSGRSIRHIRIADPRDLEKPTVRAFVKAAAARAVRPDPQAGKRPKSVVRAVYPKRRRPLIPPR
jgi:hypothetical protein